MARISIMWWWILALIVLLVAVEAIRIGVYTRRAIMLGRGTSPVSQEKPGARVRILVIGDSTSYGTGAVNPSKSLVGRLASEYKEAAIANLSENAMNLKALAGKLALLESERYALVCIHIGGIDMLTFTPFKAMHRYLAKALESAKKIAPRVVVVSMNNAGSVPAYRFPVSTLYEFRGRQMSRLFERACRESGVTHAPLFMERRDDPLLNERGGFYARDGMHPNDEGYGIWYEKIKPFLLNVTG